MPKNEEFFFLQDEASNVRRVETTTKTQTHQMSQQLSKKMNGGKSKRKRPPSPPTDEVEKAIGATGVQPTSHDTAGSALSIIDSSSETLSPSPPTDKVANAIGTTGVQASSHDMAGSALSTIDSSLETFSPSANQSETPRPLEASLLPSSDPLDVDCAGGLLAEHLALLNKLTLVLPIIDHVADLSNVLMRHRTSYIMTVPMRGIL